MQNLNLWQKPPPALPKAFCTIHLCHGIQHQNFSWPRGAARSSEPAQETLGEQGGIPWDPLGPPELPGRSRTSTPSHTASQHHGSADSAQFQHIGETADPTHPAPSHDSTGAGKEAWNQCSQQGNWSGQVGQRSPEPWGQRSPEPWGYRDHLSHGEREIP